MSDEKKVLLRISNLKQYFPIGKKQVGKPQAYVKANDGISLNIYEGETFGLVGESGCGKSTFGRTLLQLYHQTGGRTVYYGRTVEDFDLEYVEKIFKNLPTYKKKCEEAREKAAKARKEFEAMPSSNPLSVFSPNPSQSLSIIFFILGILLFAEIMKDIIISYGS